MNQHPVKVSVVVPVYKVEKYLDRCVKSLVNQTLDSIEIILVDDGSPDRCPEMCDKFAEQYEQIRVVHKVNGGLSSARNTGMEVAQGKYIGFVDSDDDVELDMYEKMYQTAEREQVDMVMADYIRRDAELVDILKTIDLEAGKYDSAKIKDLIYPRLIMGENIDYGPLLSVCICLYKLDLLKENQICFDEEVRWSEDNIFSAILGYNLDSFYYLKNEGLYHYYQNPGTITTSYKQGAWDVYCTMNRHLKEYFSNVKDYDFSRQLKLHMLYYACVCINQAATLERKKGITEIKNILESQELKETFKDFELPQVSVKLKIQLLLIKYKMAAVLYKVCGR